MPPLAGFGAWKWCDAGGSGVSPERRVWPRGSEASAIRASRLWRDLQHCLGCSPLLLTHPVCPRVLGHALFRFKKIFFGFIFFKSIFNFIFEYG